MAVGALKSLMTTLTASTFLTGVSVLFGEENIDAMDKPLPLIVVVPRGGPWEGPGYVFGQDASVENTWATKESIDVYMWSVSLLASPTPVDHADAVETLRQQVLSAFQDQRNQANADGSNAIGLFWKPVSGMWKTDNEARDRYGRAYVLSLVAEIAVPMTAPVEATVTSQTIATAVTTAQHVA